MPAPVNFRFLLAAMVMLLLFTAAYEAAVWWPSRLAPATRPARGTAVGDTITVNEPSAAAPVPSVLPVETPVLPDREPHPVFERGSWFARRPRLLHRYVGTVGGQPATALLEWQNPDSVSGSFYLHRRGPEYYLRLPTPPEPTAQRPIRRWGQVLAVEEAGWSGSPSEWRLHGRPGATLTDTWRGGTTGRPLPVVLREDYTGGVRLAIQTWWIRGDQTITDRYGRTYSSVAQVQYEFMHLPDPASVPPALRPLLSPGPANRRRLLLEGGDGDCITTQKLSVRLNDFGLFSYAYEDYCSIIGGAADERYRYALLDLRAGRWITPVSQLIPHYQKGLARLLAHHLLHDDEYWIIRRDSTWQRQLAPYLGARPDTLAATTRWLLANTGVSAEESWLTGAGLEIADWRGNYIQAFPRETFTWCLSYAELRPVVRPGTPLARMLQARKIW